MRLLRACLDSAAVKILAATCTLSTPSLILSTARTGEALGLHPGGWAQARFGHLEGCISCFCWKLVLFLPISKVILPKLRSFVGTDYGKEWAGCLLLVVTDDWNSHCWLSWPNCFAITEKIVSPCAQYLVTGSFLILICMCVFFKKELWTWHCNSYLEGTVMEQLH